MIDPVTSAAATPLQSFADAVFAAAQQTPSDHAPLLVRVGDAHLALHFDGPATTGALLPAWRSLLGDSGATPDAELFIRTQSRCGRPPTLAGARETTLGVPRTTVLSSEGIEMEHRADTGALSLWDARERRGVWWGRSAEAISTAERALPLGPVLRWALRSLGLPVVRAGVIASQRGGLLVVGPPAGGTSSTVLAARRLGLAAIADDAVAIDPATSTAFPVTGFAMVDNAALHRMPELLGRLAQLPRTADGKQALLLDERPLRTLGGTPLRGIVVPRLEEPVGEPELLDGTAADLALTRAATTQPLLGQLADEPLPEALRDLPAYEIGLDGQPDAIAGAIAGIFRTLP